jgi:2-polyprenyl-6-methoxyphenol hydroxylase-like FAD-dependent oxidoreductase
MSTNGDVRAAPRIVVVGAGIGGLASAVALHQAGAQVTVAERASQITEIGAALSLWTNALAACEALGVAGAISKVASPELGGGVNAPNGSRIVEADPDTADRSLGGPAVLIHRARLQRVLLDATSGIDIRVGVTCIKVLQDANGTTVHLHDGTDLRSDVVIGADGIWSAVRASIGDDTRPRFTGIACWRTLVENPGTLVDSWITAGGGYQFLAAPMAGGLAYIACSARLPEGRAPTMEDKVSYLRRTFAGWHDPIPSLLAVLHEEDVLVNDLYDRPPPKWLVRGRVALMGDAAHPMTPDLGQGACQAIEDAVVLGDCFPKGGTIEEVLVCYEKRRLRRVRSIVAASARICRMMNTTSSLAAGLRVAVVRSLPPSLGLRYLARFASRDSFVKAR